MKHAVPLHAVTAKTAKAWLAAQKRGGLVSASGFTGAPGRLAALPDSRGEIAQWVLGLGDSSDSFALAAAAEHKSALHAVITDMHMPNHDGVVFVAALRQILPDIPVMVSSGRLEEDSKQQFQALGVTLFLDKPFTENQLADALRSLFSEGC